MKVDRTRAAHQRYDRERDEVDHRLDPVLPAEPGIVHCVDMTNELNQWREERAASGDAKGPVTGMTC